MDLQRWVAFSQLDSRGARRAWKHFTRRATLYKIPADLPCDRTFARDNLEAIYVDHMARAIRDPHEVRSIQDVPLFHLGDAVVGRRWNEFGSFGARLDEANMRVNESLFVPHDSHDLPLTLVMKLRETYARTSWWCDEKYYPSAVACPLPPLLFYFTEAYKNGSEEVKKMLTDFMKYEFHLIFAGCWWHLASRGGQGVVLPKQTLNELEKLLDNIPMDPDRLYGVNGGQTRFRYILNRMREVASAPIQQRNVCSFPTFNNLQQSLIVWTTDSGHVNWTRKGGRQVFRDPRNLRYSDMSLDRWGRYPKVSKKGRTRGERQ